MSGINDYSQVPSSNTTINGINIAEGCAPGNVNDALRQIMADVASFSQTITSGATTTKAGLMTAADKQKLNGIGSGAVAVTANSSNGYITIGGTKTLVYSLGQATSSTLGGVKVAAGSGISITSGGKLYVPVMTGATTASAGSKGLVPAPASGANTRFLAADGTWKTPDGTQYTAFGGATSASKGSAGLVPAPAKGNDLRYLCANGGWSIPASAASAGYAVSAGTAASAASAGVAGSAASAGAVASIPNVRPAYIKVNTSMTFGAGTWAYYFHGYDVHYSRCYDYVGSAGSGTVFKNNANCDLYGIAIRIK